MQGQLQKDHWGMIADAFPDEEDDTLARKAGCVPRRLDLCMRNGYTSPQDREDKSSTEKHAPVLTKRRTSFTDHMEAFIVAVNVDGMTKLQNTSNPLRRSGGLPQDEEQVISSVMYARYITAS